MDIEGINLTQIITVAIFLLGLVALQIFLTKNKGRFSNTWKSNKRIQLIEEKAISSSEKLRIVSVDNSQFLIISNKGKKSSVIPLNPLEKRPVPKSNRNDMKIKNEGDSYNFKKDSRVTSSTTESNLSLESPKAHQLSQAIQAAREMNPAVSYKK